MLTTLQRVFGYIIFIPTLWILSMIYSFLILNIDNIGAQSQ